jgi:hypothetical protein
MSKTNSTAVSAGKATGNRFSGGKQVLGQTEELYDNVYKSDTKDQADTYLRTTQAIVDHVGVKYGRNMRMLVKKGTMKSFTEPVPPKTDSPGTLEKYKAELNEYHKAKKEYDDQTSKVFVIILGQCSPAMRNRVVNHKEYATLEDKDDVVGLLKVLKSMAFSTTGVQHPYWTMQTVLKRLAAINQGPSESVANYHRRFLATTEVIETQWGPFFPPKLAASDTKMNDAKSRESMLSMIFLAGADKERYGALKKELNNSYLAKKDNYPTSLDTTLQLLSNYQDHTAGDRFGGDKNNEGTSFAQKAAQKAKRNLSKVRCYRCNELGHFKTECPLQQQLMQEGDSDSEAEDASH